MDRLIATNSVPSSAADTAPVSGTPQFATSGNPATSTPATTWAAYQYNAIQEELIAIIAAGGLTPDRTNNAQVLAALRALLASTGRTRILADANFYIAPTGNDSTGKGTSGAPWATPTHAANYIADNYDGAGFNAFINVADGTYTTPVLWPVFTGFASVQLVGNVANPQNCIISTTGTDAVQVSDGGILFIKGFGIETTSAGNGIRAGANSLIFVNGNMSMGTCVNDHFNAILANACIAIDANYGISGSAGGGHWVAQQSGANINCGSKTITLSGTPSFGSAFAYCDGGYLNIPGNTFPGTGATGEKYNVFNNGVIATAGAGSSYLPGSTTTAPSTGGQYV
jgi:hypothetical protein